MNGFGALLDRLRTRRKVVHAATVLHASPSLVQVTPDSILADTSGRQSWFCNGRERFATCSGVSWFHDDYLACVNVLGNAIHVYRFDRSDRTLTQVQSIVGASILKKPENISFAPDGSLVAVTDMATASLYLFRVDRISHRIELDGHAVVKARRDRTAHGVGFSRCGSFVANTTVDRPGAIHVYRVESGSGSLALLPFQTLVNEHYPLVPKGIDFGSDGRRVALCYGPNVSRDRQSALVGRLEIRSFDPHRGIGSKVLAVAGPRDGVGAAEDVRFFAGDRFVVLTHQGDDTALVLEVDPRTNRIGAASQMLRNPAARLSFPHGAGASPDGRWVAITNYGDDSLAVFGVADDVDESSAPSSSGVA